RAADGPGRAARSAGAPGAAAPAAPAPRLFPAAAPPRAGNAERPRIELDTAEALSARRGPASARLSMVLRRAGATVAAIGAGRQAFALARGPDRGEAVERVVEACLAARRDRDAERGFALARRALPPA